jgi:hypothetical protein
MKKFFFLLALASALPAVAGNMSFGQVRDKLLNQRVRISGRLLTGELRDWSRVKRGADGSVSIVSFDKLSANYAFATGTVVAVELNSKPAASKDAFGKDIDFSKVPDPYVDVIVKLEDGTEAGTRQYPRAFDGDALQLIDDAERARRDIEATLATLNGKSIYLPMYQKVYPPTIAFEDLLRTVPSSLPLPFTDVPRATALKVVETKYLDGYSRALLKVVLPNGSEGILVSGTEHFYLKREYKPSDLDRLGFYAETSLRKFTPREIASIKNVEFFKGMSTQALYWSVGLPEKENDYGQAGRQLVFSSGLIVYSKGDRVTSWQRL